MLKKFGSFREKMTSEQVTEPLDIIWNIIFLGHCPEGEIWKSDEYRQWFNLLHDIRVILLMKYVNNYEAKSVWSANSPLVYTSSRATLVSLVLVNFPWGLMH